MRLKLNGRRGAFQLLFAIVYGCLALSLMRGLPHSLSWLEEFVSYWALVSLWGAPALGALIGCLLPRPKDAYSFFLLSLAPIATGFLFLISMARDTSTSPFGFIVYWALAGAVMVVSGMTGDSDRDERVQEWKTGS